MPPSLVLQHISWPLDALLFILPKGAIRSPAGHECGFLAVSRNRKEVARRVPFDLPTVTIEQEEISWFAASEGNESFSGNLLIDARTVQEGLNENIPLHQELMGEGHSPLQVSEFTHAMLQLALKLLLAMNARPDTVSSGSCVRPARTKHGREKTALWSPNVIGRTYVVRNETSQPVGHGSAKRLHWVRGHFRQQPYGVREHPAYRTIWIEPFLSGTA